MPDTKDYRRTALDRFEAWRNEPTTPHIRLCWNDETKGLQLRMYMAANGKTFLLMLGDDWAEIYAPVFPSNQWDDTYRALTAYLSETS